MHWIPRGGERRRGRPATRWEDALEDYARGEGLRWESWAKESEEDRYAWMRREEGFIKRAAIRRGEDTEPHNNDIVE